MNVYSSILSATLFNLALQLPYTFGSFVFFIFIPIFYSALQVTHTPTFWDGVIWGLFFFSYQLYPFFALTAPPFALSVMIGGYFLVVIYASFTSGFWFVASRFFASFLQEKLWVIFCWLLATWLYLNWLLAGMFIITGRWLGNPLLDPLLPCAVDSRLLSLLHVLGHGWYLFFLLGFSAGSALFLYRRTWGIFMGTLAMIFPFLYGYSIAVPVVVRPIYLDSIAYVRPPHLTTKNPVDAAHFLCDALEDAHEKKSDALLFVSPESAYRFCLPFEKFLLPMCKDVLPAESSYIVGSYCQKGKNFLHRIYQIDREGILKFYGKRCLVPFVEYLPAWCVGMSRRPELIPDIDQLEHVIITRFGNFSLEICSDFFLDCRPPKQNSHLAILLLVNDSWSRHSMPNTLMFLFAAMKSQELKTDILYVGHDSAWLLGKMGYIFPL